jgi:tetratricopeptide (TPR) repeat protein
MAKVVTAKVCLALVIGTCTVFYIPIHGNAEDTAVIKILLSRAQAQADGGHLDIAAATWRQVLAAEPANLEALRSLASTEVRLGHQAKADEYIQRLKQAGGSAAAIGQLQLLHAGPSDQQLLRQATTLAASGQYSGAMSIYRKLYGKNPPVGDIALVYYDTMAALPPERKQAVVGLRKLASQLQGDPRYSIALGRVLTYDAATREEGMGLLRRYPTDRSADDALKQAMAWSERRRGDQDAHVQVEAASSTGAHPASAAGALSSTSELGLGFKALNAGNLSAADEHFRSASAHEATHGQAHAGLGYVRMRQQDFDGAVKEFGQAKDEGDRDPAVAQALLNSSFYRSMEAGRRGVQENNLAAGVNGYRSALAIKPENVDALIGLGGALLGMGRANEAISFLQHAVHLSANSEAAWRALFLAQSQASQKVEAINTAEHIPATVQTALDSDPSFLGSLAEAYASVGQQSESDRILKRAIALTQDEPGVETSTAKRLQYAGLLLMAKRYSTAGRGYRRVLADDPGNIEAWRGLLNSDHLAGNDSEALRELQQMPEDAFASVQKDADFLSMIAAIQQSQGQIGAARETLQRAIKIVPTSTLNLQLAALESSDGDKEYATELYAQLVDEHPELTAAWLGWIEALHAIGRDSDAMRELNQMPEDIVTELSENPDYWQSAASVYIANGKKRMAADSITQIELIYERRGTTPPNGIELQQGWLLLQAGETAQLAQVIQELNSRDDLNADQQEQLGNLWANWAMQRAAVLSRQGNHDGSIGVLGAGLRAFPDNIMLNNALADAYLEGGDPKRAVALYARLDIARAKADVCVAAINTALSANDKKQTQVWLQISLRRFAQNPKILELAARFEQQRGDPKRAAAYYRAALQSSGAPSIAELTDSSARAVGTNSVEVSPKQELLDLLTNQPARSQGDGQSAIRDEGPLDLRRSPRRSQNVYDDSDTGSPRGNQQMDHENSSLSEQSQSTRSNALPAFEPENALVAADTPQAQGHARRVLRDDGAEESTLESHYARNALGAPRIEVPAAPGDGIKHSANRATTNIEAMAPSLHDRALQEIPAQNIASEELRLNEANLHPAISNRQSSSYGNTSAEESATALAAVNQSRTRQRLDAVPPDDALVSTSVLEPLPTETIQPLPPLVGPQNNLVRPSSPRQQVEQNLQNVDSALSPYFGGDSAVGFHSGQPGFDQLTTFSANVEQSSMIGMGTRVSLIVQPTLLQSSTALPTASFRLGTLALGAVPGIQTAAGVGGEAQLQTRSFGASLGYTPRGFLVGNVTGRLVIQPGDGPVIFRFEREANQETQLSYAGLRDPGSAKSSYAGNIWGGVIDNTVSLQVKGGDAISGWYVQGGGQYITGQHVLENHRLDGYAGAYWALWQQPEFGKLTLGMNFFGMHYEDNQRLFTYGNGGYFSPGAYMLSSLPVTFDGHYQTRLQYQVKGSLGLQAFQEDASPYFPLDPGLQQAAHNPFTAERTSVGANYSLSGEASYLVTDHWHAGIAGSFNNSYDYKNEQIAFYMRYTFHPQSLDIPGGPTSLGTAILGLRPLLSR